LVLFYGPASVPPRSRLGPATVFTRENALPGLVLASSPIAAWSRLGPATVFIALCGPASVPPRSRRKFVKSVLFVFDTVFTMKMGTCLWSRLGPASVPPRSRHSFYKGKRTSRSCARQQPHCCLHECRSQLHLEKIYGACSFMLICVNCISSHLGSSLQPQCP
jgi:hypothetical protein